MKIGSVEKINKAVIKLSACRVSVVTLSFKVYAKNLKQNGVENSSKY